MAVAGLLLPPSQIETMDEVDLRFQAMVNLIKFQNGKVDEETVKKLGNTFSVFRESEYWQKFNSFFQIMVDSWDQRGWNEIRDDYRQKLGQARRDEDERKTKKRKEEIINTGMGNVILPGELEKRYKGKPGEILLKYMFLEQQIGERDYLNRGEFGPHAFANTIHRDNIFPDNEISREHNELFYRLLADFSGRETFTRKDFAREIVAIYPWFEEKLSSDDLDNPLGEGYNLGELVRNIRSEFDL